MLSYARQLRVVRDGVASFFFHLDFGADTIPILTHLIQEIQALGYTFTSPEALLLEPPVASAYPTRSKEGLLALYTFEEASGAVVHDVSGNKSPLHLNILDPRSVTWIADALSVHSNTLIALRGPQKG